MLRDIFICVAFTPPLRGGECCLHTGHTPKYSNGMKQRLVIVAAILCTLLVARSISAQEKPFGGQFGIDVSGMDRSVRPQDDFFRFVNGTWADRTEIPADKSRYGSFTILSDESEEALKEIVEQ